MSEKRRIDTVLVELGLVRSRTAAQDLIDEGLVFFEGKKITKPSFEVCAKKDLFEIQSGRFNEFVSRAGLKLKGALEHINLSIHNKTCLDIGISTGGFTDCLLQRGAKKVFGVDVGHNQLDSKLAQDNRVLLFEGLNARYLTLSQLGESAPKSGFEFIVGDVSFISLEYIMPPIGRLLSEAGQLLFLVKPQFEVGPQGLNKQGLVKDPDLYLKVEKKIVDLCRKLGLYVENYFESSIEGKDGNKEFFIFARNFSSSRSLY